MSEIERLDTDHVDHPENHPHRAHHPHAEILRSVIGFFTVCMVILLLAVGILTNAPFGNVLLSFAPILLLCVGALMLLQMDHFDLRYLLLAMLFLILLFGVLYATVFDGIDVPAVTGINLLFGVLLLLIINYSEHRPQVEEEDEPELDEEQLSALLDLIKEKAKLINIAIGRVYDVKDGGSAALRDKIKIPHKVYSELKVDKRSEILEDLLFRILARLEELDRSERDVFTSSQLTKIDLESRSSFGRSKVIDVLAKNEGENVRTAYHQILEYVNAALDVYSDD